MRSRGGIFHKVVEIEPLQAALHRAACGKASRRSVREFLANSESELERLSSELIGGTYRPGPYFQFRVMDPKPRRISCAPFRDRVVHHALCAACSPIMESRFIDDTFACRIGKGTHAAISRAQTFCRKYRYALRIDIARYFDSIRHEIVERLLGGMFREQELRQLWSVILGARVPGLPAGCGLPIGNLTSQWLANSYLDRFDHLVKEEWCIKGYVRYMDDMTFWSNEKEELWQILSASQTWLREYRCLNLKAKATHVLPVLDGIPFLGVRIFPSCIRFSPANLRRSRARLRQRVKQWMRGEISEVKVQSSARSIVGLHGYWGCKGLVRRIGVGYEL